jgi:hypothetical protein
MSLDPEDRMLYETTTDHRELNRAGLPSPLMLLTTVWLPNALRKYGGSRPQRSVRETEGSASLEEMTISSSSSVLFTISTDPPEISPMAREPANSSPTMSPVKVEESMVPCRPSGRYRSRHVAVRPLSRTWCP